MPWGCECSKRDILMSCLIVLAYLTPSNYTDHVLGRVFPGMMETKGDSSTIDNGDLLTAMKNLPKDKKKKDEPKVEEQPVVVVEEEEIIDLTWRPPIPEKTPLGLYNNSRELVHVIHTRFMQHQPDLKSLGKARLELFQTFTLPSVLRQSHQEFLWLIWMEPQLQTELRHAFIDLVKDIPNCVVLGSRAKMPYIRDDYFEELMESSVYSGSFDLLMEYHQAAASRVVLHTELDADDALFYDFVLRLQNEAKATLGQSHLKRDFRLWCARKRLEWGYYNPWDDKSTLGYLIGKESKKECPPGGYTKGYGPLTDPSHLPREGRFEVHIKTPQCEFTKHKCIGRIDGGASEYAVLRSRTPTAHGMTNVMPKKTKAGSPSEWWRNRQSETWDHLPKNFGVNQTAVVAMRAKLETDMTNILLDNLEGQCKDGFSCKRSSKDALKELKIQYKKGNKYYQKPEGEGGEGGNRS